MITNTVVSTMVEKLDADADGYNFYEDCDDHNAAAHPGGVEVTGSGADEDCDGLQSTQKSYTTGTREPLSGSFSVYPNPAGDWLRVEHDHPGALRADLIDATGRRVETAAFKGGITLPTAGMPTGIYLLRVTDVATGAASQRRVVVGRRQ